MAAGYIPACMLYGALCRRLNLRTLLWIATIAYIVEAIPLLFIHSSTTALLMSLPMALINGFAFTAYWDLALRSCPPGLQGSLMMLVAGAYELSYRIGDLVGASIYGGAATHGFLSCVVLATATSLIMVPVLRMIPPALIATRDGEATPAV
jgi:MFS-type transporter involved in bile tolerance (Atg22 family)